MLKQELTSDSHVSINDWANTEWNRCMALRGTFENHAVTYLMTANGGGAATVIAFAGAARYLAPLVLWSLGLFLSGLILSGIGIAIALSRMSWLSNTLSNDQKQFNENKLPVSDLFDNHSKRFKRKFFGTPIGYLSFVCFIAGTVTSSYTFYIFVEQSNTKKEDSVTVLGLPTQIQNSKPENVVLPKQVAKCDEHHVLIEANEKPPKK